MFPSQQTCGRFWNECFLTGCLHQEPGAHTHISTFLPLRALLGKGCCGSQRYRAAGKSVFGVWGGTDEGQSVPGGSLPDHVCGGPWVVLLPPHPRTATGPHLLSSVVLNRCGDSCPSEPPPLWLCQTDFNHSGKSVLPTFKLLTSVFQSVFKLFSAKNHCLCLCKCSERSAASKLLTLSWSARPVPQPLLGARCSFCFSVFELL